MKEGELLCMVQAQSAEGGHTGWENESSVIFFFAFFLFLSFLFFFLPLQLTTF